MESGVWGSVISDYNHGKQSCSGQPPTSGGSRPNIIMIITDDQDLHMDSMEYMPAVKKHLTDQGTTYTRHFCTTALCCPSRVSLFTGKLAHNTNITHVQPPYGGYGRFVSQGLNDNYLPVWLQNAGYGTYYGGKLFNYHTILNYNQPFAAGWTENEFLLDPFQYAYYAPCFQRNQDEYELYNGSYVTDLLATKVFGFLDDAATADQPFFLGIAPIAPHAQVDLTPPAYVEMTTSPPQPALRHAGLFSNATVPRTPDFNPDSPSGVSWIRQLPQLNASQIAYNDAWYRGRLQSLQAVDEMVDELFTRLEKYNMLENTYIFFTSDNGYHISQHRLAPGKTCAWETDINIPLIVRGPGVQANASYHYPTAHIDLAPTFFDLAGIPLREDFDGVPIPVKHKDIVDRTSAGETKQEHVNVEFWQKTNTAEGTEMYSDQIGATANDTYKALRLIGGGYNLLYSVWCTNEHELYNMTADPYQLNSLFRAGFRSCNKDVKRLATRLDGLLFVLKSCAGETCRLPWKALFPGGAVSSLKEAMRPEFDDFFATQVPRVSFTECEPGFILESEGPQYAGQAFLATPWSITGGSESGWAALT
ncbi:Arylsulphatase [Thozetella sp. PMI_491]|nr:Arylsulphatase [Thozetella sp. PMI_491]